MKNYHKDLSIATGINLGFISHYENDFRKDCVVSLFDEFFNTILKKNADISVSDIRGVSSISAERNSLEGNLSSINSYNDEIGLVLEALGNEELITNENRICIFSILKVVYYLIF